MEILGSNQPYFLYNDFQRLGIPPFEIPPIELAQYLKGPLKEGLKEKVKKTFASHLMPRSLSPDCVLDARHNAKVFLIFKISK